MGNTLLDFYEVLDIPKDSTSAEIRSAYRSLAKKWHPDKHPPSSKAEAEAKFKAITQAYEALNGNEYRGVFGVYKGGSRPASPARKEGIPKYPGTPGSQSRDYNRSKTTNYARTPGRDFKDFYYSTMGGSNKPEKARPGAFKSHSGPLRMKPPPEERKLECTLEELWKGCKKEIKFTRDVVEKNGMIVQKQESQTIRVKPGWKKGTKITFEGLGDERPGCLPADVVFLVAEKEHPTFRRAGNDLVLRAEIPLVGALAGCTFTFRLIGGEEMTCALEDEVVHPGYEKVVRGQGMPVPNEKGARGDLRIKFKIVFPTHLTSAQRSELVEILKGAT
ncbi:dnaJ protein-like protein 1-like [Iris pallida]|uniref:DnaJ protein-like protein 1-like n=1 Tax=Iris pallida TaxID=29817 RepID=A0AAX6E9X6_IRIPA|nr:dnaJ protein-like protein 1-like [Iris pallida]